ncbi:hypothetical protein [Sporosarcina sp. G11-34]|uniref:hypothetical protein n=1 Tax=Sporosarcina sp. G11-34 TaxID=2849605 RepID=UPI0022A9F5A3|nr:hypothetical protein [Sporosarcina sp. G11-34]MCZ2257320.1 hypothetical protein [Sporosarcina sp. G11-34]
MKAYLLNDYYIFTDYSDLSFHMHDVVHFSKPKLQNSSHSFSVVTGKFDRDNMVFLKDQGESISIGYEQEYDLYYSLVHE